MKYILSILLSLILFSSCKPNLDYEIHGYTQKIIVEGYIVNGEYPRVYLSLNVPLWKKVDSTTILENVIRTAKVTISDGENTEILTSGWDKSHFPPYAYKGTEIVGVTGKTYSLKIEYSGYTIYSQTTIPSDPNFLNFITTPLAKNDSLRILTMNLNVDPTKKNSFKVFTKKKKDKFFIESPFVYNSEFTHSGIQSFNINPNPSIQDSSYNEGIYFLKGDTVQIKICSFDSISTQFFKALSITSSSDTGIASGFFIGEKDALQSNISNPGFGIWYGNGIRKFELVIK